MVFVGVFLISSVPAISSLQGYFPSSFQINGSESMSWLGPGDGGSQNDGPPMMFTSLAPESVNVPLYMTSRTL